MPGIQVHRHERELRRLNGATVQAALILFRVLTKKEPGIGEIAALNSVVGVLRDQARATAGVPVVSDLDPVYRVEFERAAVRDVSAAEEMSRLVTVILRRLEAERYLDLARRVQVLDAITRNHRRALEQQDHNYHTERIQLHLEQLEQAKAALDAAVHDARDNGISWAVIGEAAGIRYQAAMTRWSDSAKAGKRRRSRTYRTEAREALEALGNMETASNVEVTGALGHLAVDAADADE